MGTNNVPLITPKAVYRVGLARPWVGAAQNEYTERKLEEHIRLRLAESKGCKFAKINSLPFEGHDASDPVSRLLVDFLATHVLGVAVIPTFSNKQALAKLTEAELKAIQKRALNESKKATADVRENFYSLLVADAHDEEIIANVLRRVNQSKQDRSFVVLESDDNSRVSLARLVAEQYAKPDLKILSSVKPAPVDSGDAAKIHGAIKLPNRATEQELTDLMDIIFRFKIPGEQMLAA